MSSLPSHPVAANCNRKSGGPLPEGPALLDRLRPLMRRNRRGAGLSGSVSYLARALSAEPQALVAAFGALGLVPPPQADGEPVFVEISGFVYWLNEDKNGQIWINAREKREGDKPKTDGTPAAPPDELPLEPAATAPDAEARTLPAAASSFSPFAAVRLLLKETRRGGVAAEVGRVAAQLGKSPEELLAALSPRRLEGAGKGAREAGLRRARRRDFLAQPECRRRAVAERQGFEVCRKGR